MPVPTSINDLSTTAGSNSPPGTEPPTLADDYLRVYASYIAALRDVVLSGTGNLSTANLTYSGTLTGSTGVLNIGAGQIYKSAAGLIGLGTATPQVKASVATTGDAIGLSIGESGSATGKTLDIAYFITADYGRIQAVHAGTGFKTLALNPSGGSVGVGTTAATHKLHVAGSLRIDAATSNSAASGIAAALPATPAGYVTINVGGTDWKLPYYNS